MNYSIKVQQCFKCGKTSQDGGRFFIEPFLDKKKGVVAQVTLCEGCFKKKEKKGVKR